MSPYIREISYLTGQERVSLVIIESGHPLSFPWRAVSENNYKLATIPPWFRRDVRRICRLAHCLDCRLGEREARAFAAAA